MKVMKSDTPICTNISHHCSLTFFIRSDFLLNFSYWKKLWLLYVRLAIPTFVFQEKDVHKNIRLTKYRSLRLFLVSTINFPWFCLCFCGASSPTTALVCSLLYFNFPRFLLLSLRLYVVAFSFTTFQSAGGI